MDAVAREGIHRTGEQGAGGEGGEIRSLKPHRDHWRTVMSRASPRPSAPRRVRGAALAGLTGVVGAASLAVLAGIRPDLGGHEVAALLPALAAACVPAALCLRLALASRGSPAADDGLAAGSRAELDARERLLFEQVAAVQRDGRETAPGHDAGARPAMRRHARITPHRTRTFVATEDGRRLNALIVDVSQSGVALEGNLPGLWIGAMVTVGSRRAKAVRALPRGMAFEFSAPIAAEALTVDLVL